jgi:hypothetical protein
MDCDSRLGDGVQQDAPIPNRARLSDRRNGMMDRAVIISQSFMASYTI